MKRYATADIKAANDGKGYEIMLSAPTLDRDGEVVDPFAFAPLPAHMNLDVDHAMTVEKIAGSGVPAYDADGTLWVRDFSFASTPVGVIAKTLVDEGHVRTVSVAFMGAEVENDDDGVPHIRKGELLNAGIVAIASNRDAFIRVAKSYAEVAADFDADFDPAPTEQEVKTALDHVNSYAASLEAALKAKTVLDNPELAAETKSSSPSVLIGIAVARAAAEAAVIEVLR